MMPNILFVGAGAGSWEVRGKQIGAALGARVTTRPNASDWRWADVVILVKRAIDDYGHAARQSHLPVIWDALDFWQQPEENSKPIAEHIATVNRYRQTYGLVEVIAATRAMSEDLGGVYIPHHARAGLMPTPVRERAEVVAYEGTKKYLGRWLDACERACAERGMRFVVNPPSLMDADIVVAFRDGKWDGEVCRRWKSGVKFVNAIQVGRPVITQQCAAFTETSAIGMQIESIDQFGAVLDALDAVRPITADIRTADFSLRTVAAQYRSLVSSVLKVAA